jgi:hypothetical protein
MHTKEPREDPLVEMGYEVRDIDFPKVRLAAIIFFAFTGLCALIGWIMYTNRFKAFALTPPKETGALKTRVPGPQYPLLQDNMDSKMDISTLRHAETVRMTSTGYNPDGTVHIPLDRAMELIAQRGLPQTHHVVPAVNNANIVGPNVTGPLPVQHYGTPNPGTPEEAAGAPKWVEPKAEGEATPSGAEK